MSVLALVVALLFRMAIFDVRRCSVNESLVALITHPMGDVDLTQSFRRLESNDYYSR